MKLQIEIDKVAAQSERYYFIAVQLDYKDNNSPSIKMRTDLAHLDNRPKFKRNLFTFNKLIQQQSFKFGLMACPDSNEDNIKNSIPVGIGSLNISLDRLKQLPPEGQAKIIHFISKKKEVGQFQCKIQFKMTRPKQSQNGVLTTNYQQFNPLLSRVLYSQQASKDQLKMENSIVQLERQAQLMYQNFKSLKFQEETLERIYQGLQKDEEEFKNEIELNEKINQKISMRMTQRQSAQSLKLEIDMLKNSEEGKGLLLQKLEYFEERIKIERMQQMKLSQKYQKIKHQLDARIQKAEDYANRLKGKELQLFQLDKNRQILKKYEDVEYQFNCNQHIIQTLVSQAKKNELSADQAALILSQVNHKIKLEEVNVKCDEQDTIINMIEKQAATTGKTEAKEESQSQKMVFGIKLKALEQQTFEVKSKIQQVLAKKHIQQSGVRRF